MRICKVRKILLLIFPKKGFCDNKNVEVEIVEVLKMKFSNLLLIHIANIIPNLSLMIGGVWFILWFVTIFLPIAIQTDSNNTEEFANALKFLLIVPAIFLILIGGIFSKSICAYCNRKNHF